KRHWSAVACRRLHLRQLAGSLPSGPDPGLNVAGASFRLEKAGASSRTPRCWRLLMTTSVMPRLEWSSPRLEKLGRLAWVAGTAFLSHGVRVGIRANDHGVLEQVGDYMPPLWRPSSSSVVDLLYSLVLGSPGRGPGKGANLLYSGVERRACSQSLRYVLVCLENSLEIDIALRAPDRLFVHAGVVGWHGKAILIPGRSLAGKTELVAALLRAGATYYSDEFAVLDASGCVHPHPVRLGLRARNGRPGKRFAVEELGGHSGTQPLEVALVAVLKYRPGARWRPRALSPGKATLALLANTVCARTRPRFALDILRRVAERAVARRGARGEAEDVAAPLLEQLESLATVGDRVRAPGPSRETYLEGTVMAPAGSRLHVGGGEYDSCGAQGEIVR